MASTQTVIDQVGRRVTIPRHPQKIISLVPSQTELLFDLGLEDRLAGVTKFCLYPKEKVKSIPRIGGTKNFRFEAIRKLNPDLIIGNKEENYKEGVEQLATEYPVWLSDIATLEEALCMIRSVGEITDTTERAQSISDTIRDRWNSLPDFRNRSVIYFIWKDPWMTAGKNTFIDHVLSCLHLTNMITEDRYPVVDLTVSSLNPDYVFLSTEPYPFRSKHLEEVRSLFPKSRVRVVDGEFFSWYGSRLSLAPAYFEELSGRLD